MSEINTTSINDLPTDPSTGGSIGGNINLVINEPAQNTVMPPQSNNSSNSSDIFYAIYMKNNNLKKN